MILLEIDRFDEIAQEFGESASKTMLKATSQFLKATMREMDHVSRFDHRQFALLLPKATAKEAGDVAERLRLAIDNCKLPADGGILKFTVSLAVESAQDRDNAKALMDRALQTVERLVANGGNRCNIEARVTV